MIETLGKPILLYYLRKMEATLTSSSFFERWLPRHKLLLFGLENDKPVSVKDGIGSLLAGAEIPDITAPGFDPRFGVIANVFKLDPPCVNILRYLYYEFQLPSLRALRDIESSRDMVDFLSIITDIPHHECVKMATSSSLTSKGIVCAPKERRAATKDLTFGLTSFFTETCIFSPWETADDLLQLFFGNPVEATLPMERFNHLGTGVDDIRALLGAAVKNKKPGMNILLHGATGTGKTEMAKTLAKEAGATLYQIQADNKTTKEERLNVLAIAQDALAGNGKTVLLVDDAEDLLHCGSSDWFRTSRTAASPALKGMLENNKAPIIWIVDSASRINFAFVQQFNYAFELPALTRRIRKTIWENMSSNSHIHLTTGELDELADRYDVPPSLIERGVATAQDVQGIIPPLPLIGRTIDNLLKATGKASPSTAIPGNVPFDTALMNADMDLATIAEKLVIKRTLRVSFCLYGVPGTGKSAFARHLAKQLNLEVIQKRASDIMDTHVGQTEKNIARAFTQARDEKAVLVFDEADSFLRSRKHAVRSWEIAFVNEMLTWMENHPLPFICTTNLMDELDEASLRRFTFKVRYSFLTPGQIAQAFRHFFGVSLAKPPPHLTRLSPGDFAVVKSKVDLLDIRDAAQLIELLECEQTAKADTRCSKPVAGFGAWQPANGGQQTLRATTPVRRTASPARRRLIGTMQLME